MGVKETFGARLRALRGEQYQKTLADELGISRAALGYYEKATRTPDIEILEKVCKHFKVSPAFMLGFSDAKTSDIDVQTVCDNLGLTETSVNVLRDTNLWANVLGSQNLSYPYYLDAINALIEDIAYRPLESNKRAVLDYISMFFIFNGITQITVKDATNNYHQERTKGLLLHKNGGIRGYSAANTYNDKVYVDSNSMGITNNILEKAFLQNVEEALVELKKYITKKKENEANSKHTEN